MPTIHVDVDRSGPLFDGRADRAARDYVDAVQLEVGKQGLAEVHTILDASIRHPTPYYETQLVVERAAPDVVVHDRGIVYGPWLEGVGSRNKTTRFKGYFAFRRARHRLEQLVPAIAERVLQRFLRRMS
jgi:hypothetical protein